MTLNDLISTKHFDEKEYNSLMNSSHQRKENNTEIVKNTVSEETSNLLKEYLVNVVEKGQS